LAERRFFGRFFFFRRLLAFVLAAVRAAVDGAESRGASPADTVEARLDNARRG
jgi:hypothetical protein